MGCAAQQQRLRCAPGGVRYCSSHDLASQDGVAWILLTRSQGTLWCHVAQGYVVLHRPYGLLQWVQKYARRLQEDYILMSEPDHLFLKLPPLW